MGSTPEEVGLAGTRVKMRDGFSFEQRQLCSRVLRGPCCGFQFCFMGSPGNSSLETSRLTHQLMQQLQTHHTHMHNQPGPFAHTVCWPGPQVFLEPCRPQAVGSSKELGAGGWGWRPGTKAGDRGRGWGLGLGAGAGGQGRRPGLEPRLARRLGLEDSKVPAETWAQTMAYLVAIFNGGDSPSPAPTPSSPSSPSKAGTALLGLKKSEATQPLIGSPVKREAGLWAVRAARWLLCLPDGPDEDGDPCRKPCSALLGPEAGTGVARLPEEGDSHRRAPTPGTGPPPTRDVSEGPGSSGAPMLSVGPLGREAWARTLVSPGGRCQIHAGAGRGVWTAWRCGHHAQKPDRGLHHRI